MSRGIDKKAILYGVLANFIGAIVVSFIVGAVIGQLGVKADQVRDYLKQDKMLIIKIVIGIFLTITGGWIAAHFGRKKKIAHGAWTGGISLVAGIPFLLGNPWWYAVIMVIAAIPSGMAGGYISQNYRSIRRFFV